MNQAEADREHARCVALSRENAARWAREAVEAEARGDKEGAARLRDISRRSREEADMQESAGAARVRRPGVRNAADKAEWERRRQR